MASISGRPTTPEGRRGSSAAAEAEAADGPAVLIRAGDALAGGIIAALMEGDVERMRKFQKGLEKTGSSLLEAVAAAKPAGKVVDSLLHLAARSVRYEACMYLIKDLHLDVNCAGEHGQTPIISAIYGIDSAANNSHKKKESERIIELLLRRGADLNKTKPDGFAPLHAATLKDSFDITKLLLAKGASVNAICQSGTALHIAAESGTSMPVVQLLLDHGADPSIANISELTALHVAVNKDSFNIAKLLLANGANINAFCQSGTVLHIAAEGGTSMSLVQLLLDQGADTSATNSGGLTALHVAVMKESYYVAELLLGKGADVDAACEKGTPLHIAAGRDSLKILGLLLQNAASTDISDMTGRKAIEVAAISGNRDCVVMLFPLTSAIDDYQDWSIDGIMHAAKNDLS